MPTFTVTRGKKNRREIDIPTLVAIFDSEPDVKVGFVEIVTAMRQRPGQENPENKFKQGLASTFSLGKHYGIILGVMTACGLSITRISPVKWKRKVGLIGSAKDDSRRRASELWPQCSGWWRHKIHGGRAEACLIGFVGIHHGPQAREDDDDDIFA